MAVKLGYAIHFVADMDRAVAFYRDTIGIELKTGATTLALHPASAENPAGTTHLGLHADDIAGVYRSLTAAGVRFTRVPMPEHGITLAEFVDSEGARVSLSG